MSRRKLAVCVTTSKPSLSLSSSGGGGGSVVMLCPHTGSILSSLRASGDNSSKSLLGMSSMSLFPSTYSTASPLVIAYGGTTTKRDDTYAMLCSLRSSASPLIHWKSRLPEAQLSAGILVSPCGNYIVGGGVSGSIFVWKALGGSLCRSVKAHYRSVTSMSWSDCGNFLVTGGADGMIHVFSLLHLVEVGSNETTVTPIRTWSVHHLPVTSLLAMPSDRMIASSQDGQLVMLELFSQNVIWKIQMPQAIRALAYCNGRLFAGNAVDGSIYMIDLDEYAIHQTAQLGVTVKRTVDRTSTRVDQVFSVDTSEAYKTELLGHEKPITSLAVFSEDDIELLVSGDDAGEIRIWDLQSRGCVRVIRPWSHSGVAAKTTSTAGKPASKAMLHPVTSITIVRRDEPANKSESAFVGNNGATKKGEAKTSIVSLIPPLQRFADRPSDNGEESSKWIPVPFMQPKRRRLDLVSQSYRLEIDANSKAVGSKRPRNEKPEAASAGTVIREEESDEVLRLQRELEEAKSTILRWEKVNNTLMEKLQQS